MRGVHSYDRGKPIGVMLDDSVVNTIPLAIVPEVNSFGVDWHFCLIPGAFRIMIGAEPTGVLLAAFQAPFCAPSPILYDLSPKFPPFPCHNN